MKIRDVWLDIDLEGKVSMYASVSVPWPANEYSFVIFPANAPSARRFFKAFQSGKSLYDDDAREVRKAARAEGPTTPWKIVDMKVEPNDEGIDVLKTTLQSRGLEMVTGIWPPRAPSARLFLDAFRRGKQLYDKDLGLLILFVREEAAQVGIFGDVDRGILDWNPDWDEYL